MKYVFFYIVISDALSQGGSLLRSTLVTRLNSLCHLPIKAIGKEPFVTCQKRQSAKNFCFEKN